MDDKYHIEFFEKEKGVYPAEEYINTLDNKMSAKVYRTLVILENNGPALREPYSKYLDDGIFELRIKISTNLARVLYFFYVGQRIVATHGFTKKTKKTPPDEIGRAKAYRKAFLDKEAQKNENS
jgi:phage-related protein